MSLTSVACIDDLRSLAKRRVPRAFFDYCDRGSYDEQTLDANRRDLKALRLRQRVLVDVSNRTMATTMLGVPRALPLALAPVGLTGLQHGDGEILAARAAEAANIPFTLSTMSICSIEDVAAATNVPFWFQIYVMRDRGFSESLVRRAAAAGCSALVVTADLQVQGQRHRDIKNGMTIPPRVTLANLLDIATKPGWVAGVLRGKRKTFGNLQGVGGLSGAVSLTTWIASQFDPSLSWKDIDWLRRIWPGKMIIKGILDEGDAAIAVSCGADAIVVSNHGGRQLDGAPSAISALPGIAEKVGGATEIYFDSGIRSGQDVLRALALGARACMIGRAWNYGLGAAGQEGVAKAIDIIARELDVSMALTGRSSLAEIDRSVLVES